MSIRRCRISKRQTPAVLVISLSAAETYGPVGRRAPGPSCLCNNSIVKKRTFGKSCGQVRQPRVREPLARAQLHFTALFDATPILEDVRPSASTGSPMRQAMWRSSDTSRRAFKPFPHPGAGQHLVAGGRGPQRGPVEILRSAPAAMVRLRVCRVERRGAVGVHPGEAATRHERLLVVVLRALVPPMHAATGLAPRAAAAAQDPAVVEASLDLDRASPPSQAVPAATPAAQASAATAVDPRSAAGTNARRPAPVSGRARPSARRGSSRYPPSRSGTVASRPSRRALPIR